MQDFTESNLTDAVVARIASAADDRFRKVMTALVRHLHAFVREVELTEAEWLEAIRFLTSTGQICNDKRQEFILLSDTLGVSMLLDALNHRRRDGGTESTVLGPFYREGARILEQGGSIAGASEGEPVVVSGRVLDSGGAPIARATLDVWQTAPNGFYDVQDPTQPDMNLRGKFRSGADGSYTFRTVKPVSYPIPTDGPVGQMLLQMGRHPFRPAHIHFIVSAAGYSPVTTHLFTRGDKYLESDVVFGVKNSLIVDYEPQTAGGLGVRYDFVLEREADR